jgi:isopentenyldiphosphate isomerase
MSEDEILEVVNTDGEVIRTLPRSEIHGDPSLIHKVVHVLVFNSRGELILQKRSMDKDVAAGKWDTSVGGHVNPGESLDEAVIREMEEELGIRGCKPEFLYSYIHSNPYETELVYTFSCIHDGEINFNTKEIDEVRPWRIEEIGGRLDEDIFSENFKHEFRTYLEHKGINLEVGR